MFDPAALPADLRTTRDASAARIEDAALTASQPSEQSFYDGWLLRYSPGRAKRARSVNAVAADELALAEKLGYCRDFYARNGLPCLFRMTPFSQPAGLDAQLAAAGYAAAEESRIMTLALADAASPPGRWYHRFRNSSKGQFPCHREGCQSRSPHNPGQPAGRT